MTTPDIAEALKGAEWLEREGRARPSLASGMLPAAKLLRAQHDELERLRAQVASLSREAWTWSKALEAQLAAQVAPVSEWKGLTEQERAAFVDAVCDYGTVFVSPLFALAESLEDTLKARNNASPAAPAQQADLRDDVIESLRGDLAEMRALCEERGRKLDEMQAAPSLTVGEREAFATAAKAQGYSVRWCEGVPDVVDGFDNAPTAHAWKGWQLRAALAPAAQAEPADFTDWGRAAVAWVLWHHQGGSSAIGQPLRFALGLAAHEPLPAHLVASAQEWAKSVGATTDEFHRQKGAQAEPLTANEIAELWFAQNFFITDIGTATDFVRDVERAHGIVSASNPPAQGQEG